MTILSIQSHVAYGRVGNRAAAFALERLGYEVWPVDTVTFSNHPAYGGHRGRVVPPEEVGELIAGVGERGGFARCAAVLSGYLGDPGTGAAVLEAVAAVKRANPHALYCLDPVMGDPETGLFVDPALPAFFGDRALAAADIVVPNGFELGLLAGAAVASVGAARDAAAALLARGPAVVVATGLREDDAITTVAVTAKGAWAVRTPVVAAPAYGAGDLFTALFLARYLERRDVAAALARAVESVFAVFEATAAAGADALAIVAAQDALVDPPARFAAEMV